MQQSRIAREVVVGLLAVCGLVSTLKALEGDTGGCAGTSRGVVSGTCYDGAGLGSNVDVLLLGLGLAMLWAAWRLRHWIKQP
jgi:hypothetical protein